ncbi:MAG: hypothetical protein AB7Q17_10450 [Phycisphaerae bacterium]
MRSATHLYQTSQNSGDRTLGVDSTRRAGEHVWLVNHAGGTVLRCAVLEVSRAGMKLRVPVGYGVAEGQQYELSTDLPGAHPSYDEPQPHAWVGVLTTHCLEEPDAQHVDVEVVAGDAALALSAF